METFVPGSYADLLSITCYYYEISNLVKLLSYLVPVHLPLTKIKFLLIPLLYSRNAIQNYNCAHSEKLERVIRLLYPLTEATYIPFGLKVSPNYQTDYSNRRFSIIPYHTSDSNI